LNIKQNNNYAKHCPEQKIPRTYVRGITFWWSLAGSNR
jgi:hypothetical protein